MFAVHAGGRVTTVLRSSGLIQLPRRSGGLDDLSLFVTREGSSTDHRDATHSLNNQAARKTGFTENEW